MELSGVATPGADAVAEEAVAIVKIGILLVTVRAASAVGVSWKGNVSVTIKIQEKER